MKIERGNSLLEKAANRQRQKFHWYLNQEISDKKNKFWDSYVHSGCKSIDDRETSPFISEKN